MTLARERRPAAAGWSVLSASAAPVLLIGGWTIAARLQPSSYDPIRDTISVLAGLRAHDRWFMTAALVGLGLCHLVTAAGAQAVGRPGRATLALGGAATLAVAAFPLPAHGQSASHTAAATCAFIALAVWPVFGVRRTGPTVLRPVAVLTAAVLMLALLGWFVFFGPARSGLAERAATAAQALWPLVVVLALRAGDRVGRAGAPAHRDRVGPDRVNPG